MLGALLGLAAMPSSAVLLPSPVAPPIFAPPPAPPVPRPSPHDPASLIRLFTADDYPSEAMRLEQQGTVAYRATVGTDGRVSGCQIVTSSGSASLDAATCTIIQRRARFRPALDHRGKPIEDHFTGRIRWVLPEPDPTPFADQRNLAIFTIDGAGSVVGCRVEESGAEPSGEPACPALWPLAQRIVAHMKSHLPITGRELVMEQGFLVGGPDAANFIGQRRGERILIRAAFALSIDGLGKVIDCGAVKYPGHSGGTQDGCESDRKRGFSPLAPSAPNQASRHAVRYMATYTRSPR